MGLKKKLKKVERKIRKPIKKIGKKVERKIRKPIKRIIKDAIIPVTLTVATGGAAAPAFLSSAATTVATYKIKDPVIKAVVGAAINGKVTGSTNLTKDCSRSGIAAAISKKNKNPVIGKIIGSVVSGDYRNSNEMVRDITKSSIQYKINKHLAKKCDPQLAQLLSYGASNLSENIYNKLTTQGIQTYEEAQEYYSEESVQNNDEDGSYTNDDYSATYSIDNNGNLCIAEYSNDYNTSPNLDNLLSQPQEEWVNDYLNKYKHYSSPLDQTNLYTETAVFNQNSQYKLSNKNNINQFTNNVPHKDSPKSVKDRISYNPYSEVKQSLTPDVNYNLDSGNTSMGISYQVNDSHFGKNKLEINPNEKSISYERELPVTKNLSVGNTIEVKPDNINSGIQYTYKKTRNEYGIGIDKKWSWDSELYGYHKNTIEEDNLGVNTCITKNTYRKDLSIPLSGQIGSIRQTITTCPKSTTVLNRVGINPNGAITAASLVPVIKGGQLFAQSGKLATKLNRGSYSLLEGSSRALENALANSSPVIIGAVR